MAANPTVAEAVRPLAERFELEPRLSPYAPHRWHGRDSGLPTLHLDDVSGIPFVQDVSGVEEYQHRARIRARTEDMFVAVTPQSEGYEEYCRTKLALGRPEFVLAQAGDHGYAVADACLTGTAFDRIVDRARSAGGLQIHPYMAIEQVWELAERVAEAAGVSVEVIGPPPPVLWIANDKSALSELVTRTLSADWIVETRPSTEPGSIADAVHEIASSAPRVGLKRARCASGLGNAVYDAQRLRTLSRAELLAEVEGFLARTEWPGGEQVLAVAWEETDCSPSTQLWVPPPEIGPPVVEGVYEQLLEGDNKVFVGSRPSTLPEAVNRALVAASLTVATGLQELGYVGRCSFDFILVGDPEYEFRLKVTECNGRWGGTSTPMHLVDRVIGGQRPAYWAQDYEHRGLAGVGFPELLERLGDAVFDPRSGGGHYILYNVGPLARHGKFDVVAIAGSAAEAEELVRSDLARRLGLDC